jgi:demethylmenaquinone methyltransferase/2-methoxy-6-polyprenyl-1,4-benzoquinol methylase
MGDHPARSPFRGMAEWFTVTRADLDKQPHEVAEMFDGVAERYDFTNTVLSFGQDRGWRRATRAALALRPGERVLDVGAGTGVSTEELGRSVPARPCRSSRVTPCTCLSRTGPSTR